MKLLFALILTLPVFHADAQLKDGRYRWTIERSDHEKIVFTGIIFTANKQKNMYIVNGQDSLLVDDIIIKGDSAYFELPFFESSFRAKVNENGSLTGNWIKKSAGKIVRKLPFTATEGQQRFPVRQAPQHNISGEWQTTFEDEEGKKSDAIGEFAQKNDRLTGTFRTPYGDYRFLEGVVSGDSVYLSGFDGSYAILFKGKIYADDDRHQPGLQIKGKMYSGDAAPKVWTSTKATSPLQLEEQVTRVRQGAEKLNFTFPDVNGKPVSIVDPKFENKVVVVQIMGSWCPNCLDEMKFIMENYDRYKQMGVEFIALAYERTDNFEESKKALQPFLQRFKIPYPVLIVPVAVSDEQRTEKTLPQLEAISAFPTTIFVDKKGNIAKIHTGFDGPATGIHFEKYKENFEETLRNLLQQ